MKSGDRKLIDCVTAIEVGDARFERVPSMETVKNGPMYIVYRFGCCGREYAESKTDPHATEIPGTYCPFCGTRLEGCRDAQRPRVVRMDPS